MSVFQAVPSGYVLTSGAGSALTWTNAVSVSSMTVSSLGASNLTVSTLTTSTSVTSASLAASTLTVSSITANSVGYSTLSGSTITTTLLNYSSLVGSSISTNAMTLSLTNASTQNTRIYQVATTNPTTSYTAIQASHVSTGTTNNALALNPSGGNVGVGTTTPQATLHVQGGTLVTNPTVYNTAVAGWFIIGLWDCSAAPNTGAHLKLRVTGGNGYDNSGSPANQMGGETTIYLNNLNNTNTTTLSNMDGIWKHEGGLVPIMQVKAVQNGSSRSQYFVYAFMNTFTQHSITAETTQGTIWTSQFTSTTDPGANSLTVRALTLSSAAVGANVGIGTTAPGPRFHVVGGNIGVNGGNGIGFRMDISGYSNNIGASAIYAAGLDAMRFVGESDSATPRYFVYGHHTGNDPAQAWNPRLYINSFSGTFFPGLDNTATCGGSGNRWQIVYAINGTIQTSDSNVKDSVPLSYGMNEILQMRTIKYKWKSQADLPEDDPAKNFEYYGFCADELAPLFPELVYNENTSAPVQMNYSEILPVVVNALKEEHASAVSLKATVDHQAEQIVSLQTQLGSLLAWAQTMGYPASS